jgi:transcriptional regulator with XRE-family HTH domain
MDEEFRRWLKEALAREGRTQAELGRAIGLSPSAMSRLVNAGRGLKAQEMQRIYQYLGAAPPGFAEAAATFDSAVEASDSAPVYASFARGGAWTIMRSKPPVDLRPKAPSFSNAAMVFGFYAPNDAAYPRFKPGEIVWIDPARPIKAGDDVAFLEKLKSGERAVVGELRERRGGDFLYYSYADKQEHRRSASHGAALHILARQ